MTEHILNHCKINAFAHFLQREEKSDATIEKYIRDVQALANYIGTRRLTKNIIREYKQKLIAKGYAVKSINSMIASINSLLRFIGREECRVKNIRQQRKIYLSLLNMQVKQKSKAFKPFVVQSSGS